VSIDKLLVPKANGAHLSPVYFIKLKDYYLLLLLSSFSVFFFSIKTTLRELHRIQLSAPSLEARVIAVRPRVQSVLLFFFFLLFHEIKNDGFAGKERGFGGKTIARTLVDVCVCVCCAVWSDYLAVQQRTDQSIKIFFSL
jgi:hypothetical protein